LFLERQRVGEQFLDLGAFSLSRVRKKEEGYWQWNRHFEEGKGGISFSGAKEEGREGGVE